MPLDCIRDPTIAMTIVATQATRCLLMVRVPYFDRLYTLHYIIYIADVTGVSIHYLNISITYINMLVSSTETPTMQNQLTWFILNHADQFELSRVQYSDQHL